MSKQTKALSACAAVLAATAFGLANVGRQAHTTAAVRQSGNAATPAAAARMEDGQAEAKIAQLKAAIPPAPAVADRKTLLLMREVAETKRQEAAPVLVKALAFNLDPLSSDETLTLAEKVPAIGLLKEAFGESVAPVLYAEATASEQKWYRDRIALAVRNILSPKTVKEMNARFSVETSADPKVKEFNQSLKAKNLKVKLARPDEELMRRVGEAVERVRQQNEKKKQKKQDE
jgi:hypothetical protein